VVIGITKYSVKKVLNDKFKNISLSWKFEVIGLYDR
jgi:hypothetical protein